MRLLVEKVLILKSVDMFSETSEDILIAMAPILEEYEFAENEVIFEKDDFGESMFVIIEGTVRIHHDDHEIALLQERDVFGELAVLDPEPRSATATAAAPSKVFKITQQALYDALYSHPEIAHGIMTTLCRRIRSSLSLF